MIVSIMGGTGHPLGLAAGKGRRWKVLPSWHVALWLTPEESAGQRLWRGQRTSNRLRATSGGETRGYRLQSPPIPTCVQWNFRMWLWGTPGYGGWPLIKINSFHNNIWFDLIIRTKCHLENLKRNLQVLSNQKNKKYVCYLLVLCSNTFFKDETNWTKVDNSLVVFEDPEFNCQATYDNLPK